MLAFKARKSWLALLIYCIAAMAQLSLIVIALFMLIYITYIRFYITPYNKNNKTIIQNSYLCTAERTYNSLTMSNKNIAKKYMQQKTSIKILYENAYFLHFAFLCFILHTRIYMN